MYEIEIYDSPVQYLYDKMVWIGWLRHRDEISMERAEQLREKVLKKALEMEQKRGGLEKPNTNCKCKKPNLRATLIRMGMRCAEDAG